MKTKCKKISKLSTGTGICKNILTNFYEPHSILRVYCLLKKNHTV
jgi:hypothetical protein